MDSGAVQHIIGAAKESVALPEPEVVSGKGFAFLAEPIFSGGSRSWTLRDVPFAAPRPEALKLHTLAGIVEYIKDNRDVLTLPDLMLHVVNEARVVLMSKVAGAIPERTYHVVVEFAPLIGGAAFKFGQFQDAEDFNIALQTLFEDVDDRAAVLACSGNMRADMTKQASDDGVTQEVVGRAGVVLGRPMAVPNPVTLRPFRTFREVFQPSSKFVFRTRGGGEDNLPQCALFEADGGAWKLEAIKNIRRELALELTVEAKQLVTILA